jgi:hypothetical protein
MSQQVDIEGVGPVEFPDGMSQADMTHAIETELMPSLKSGGLKLGGASPAAQAPQQAAPQSLSYGDKFDQLKAIPGQLDSMVRSLANGMTFGGADRLEAVTEAATGVGGQQGDYADALAAQRAKTAQFQQDHPIGNAVLNTAGNVLGMAALPELAGGARAAGVALPELAVPASTAGRVLYGAGTGAAAGGIQGASNSPDWTDLIRTAKDTAEGGGLGAVFGGAMPVVGTGFNAVRNFFANPEGAIVGRALQGVDDATLARAQALMEDAQGRGIQLTSAEAVQQASNGASGLGRLQRLTEGTTGGSAVLSPIMADRQGQVSGAFNAVLDRITPPADQPSMIGVRGREAANGAIDTVRRDINTATQPLYRAAEGQTLSADNFAPIANDPAFRASLARLRADPVLGPTYAGQLDNSIGVIDAVTKDMGARGQALSNAANPGFQPEAAAIYSRGAGEARDIARDPQRGGNADYDAALLAQAQARRDNLAPLEAGPLGTMANTANTGAQANALFPSKPLEGAAIETADAIGRLNTIDPELAQNLVRQHLATNFAEATQSNIPGANQWGGANFAAQIAGNPLQEQTLMRGLAALPNGETAAADVAALMPVLRATGKRQGPGSLTAQNTLDLKEMAAPGGAAAIGETALNPLGLVHRIGDAMTRARLERRSGAIANALTDNPADAIAWLRGAQGRAAPIPVPTALSPIAALLAARYGGQ